MDFGFLFRPERRLLSIGYRVESGELDEACYDLLASECRLTSLFGIAKGDLPTEHWYKLGRQVVPVGARGALVSWSGSMFEYLMPPLVMQERGGGILNQTNNLVVHEQMNHGSQARHAVGHFGSGVQCPRPQPELPVHQLRRTDARPEAWPWPQRRHRALCFDPRQPVRS